MKIKARQLQIINQPLRFLIISRWASRFIGLVMLVFINISNIGHAQNPPLEEKEVELEEVRARIKDVQSNISEARNNTSFYQAEIQEIEMATILISNQLAEIDEKIKDHEITLVQLNQKKREQEESLVIERRQLATQIRVAYKTGHNDFIKLLLNQEDPALIDRMMAYHDAYNKARTKRISDVTISLQNLSQLKFSIDNESLELALLRDEQIERLNEHQEYRGSRELLIANLQKYITDQARELEDLQINEEDLTELLNDLRDSQPVIEMYEELTHFNTLRGKLKWPVDGKIITGYGSVKKGGKLKWNGVRITAKSGEDVNAISAGKVIFADWFRNMGLLTIVDHGDGYMSLYGHNERLLKKAGDFVSAGEQIAKVGDTGGQTQTALYFEIRQQGNHLDPALWCKR